MKPYVTTFVLSEDIKEMQNNDNTKVINIWNPLHLIRPPFMPGTYSFALSFGIMGIEPHKSHTLGLKIVSPNENDEPLVNIVDSELPPNNQFSGSGLPEEANGIMFNMDLRNIPFRVEGKYIAKIFFNGVILSEFPFLVYPLETKK